MPQSFAITFRLNDVISFRNEVSVPADLQDKSYRVARIKTLILNDFYFNNEVFTCYELTSTEDSKNTLFITPFRFEDDDEDKIRITKPLSDADRQALFPEGELGEYFRKSTSINEAQTISIDERKVPSELANWLGRSYYLDLKENTPAVASYVDYDPKNKKNLNPELLLSKHDSLQYALFQGDYALYYLEANLDAAQPLLATVLLEENCIDSQ